MDVERSDNNNNMIEDSNYTEATLMYHDLESSSHKPWLACGTLFEENKKHPQTMTTED